MTDMHTYTSTGGTRLSIRLREEYALAHGSTRLFLGVDSSGMFIPTADLLAVIDAADPDGMRAYLRETVEPETIDLIDGTTLRVTPEQLDAIPEADGPDDVIERPSATAERLAVLGQVSSMLRRDTPAEVLLELAEWAHTGTRTMGLVGLRAAREDVSR